MGLPRHYRAPECDLSVLHRHRVGVNGFLARYAFQPRQNTAIVVLVALHGKAAFFVTINPRQTDIVFFRFREGHKSSNAEGHDSQTDGGPNASMDILSIANFGLWTMPKSW